MTRDGGGKPTRGGRQLTDEEAELWRHLGRTVDKVKKKQRVTDLDEAPKAAQAEPIPPPHRASSTPTERRVAAPARPPIAPPPGRAQAPHELDRRAHRQVSGGKVPIDGVLDLHGLRQDAAHGRLRAFLMRSQANGLRMVLIITGKGADRVAPSDGWSSGEVQRGVLRRSVPLWLEEPDLRDVVLSYAAAGVRHGGEGALYVRLRKPRRA